VDDEDEIKNRHPLGFDFEEKTPVEPFPGAGPDRPRDTYDKAAAIAAANRALELQQELAKSRREVQRLKRLTSRQAEEIIRLGKSLIAERAKKEE
jgi:hypothetical protein